MKKILRVGSLLAVIVMTASSQWVLQPSVTTAGLIRVKFTDHSNGWILGNYWNKSGVVYRSSILKTSNAGTSWSEQIFENCALYGIEFVNSSVGWAVGKTLGKSGLIYKTTDGGTTWNLADSSAARTGYYTIQFIDSSHGWIGGWSDSDTASVVLRTTNGGPSWQKTIDKTLDVNQICFLDAVNGWIVGEDGKVYKSTDGGTTWQAVFTTPDPLNLGRISPLRRIQFTDPMHGYAAGGISGGGTTLWTSNGGVTWNVVNSPGSSLHGLWFTDSNNGWTVGGGTGSVTIHKTTDGGQTWAKQQFPTNLGRRVGYFWDITFVTATEGWIVADSGVVLKTTNGGEQPTYVAENFGAIPEFRLNQNYPNPFNPSTTISFNLPSKSNVSLKVIDILGREIATLVSEEMSAGNYTRKWNAVNMPSGIYFYRLRAGEFLKTEKMILMK